MVTEHKPKFEKGIFFILLSAAGLSCFTLFVKLSSVSVSFYLLSFLRFIVPLVLILIYMGIRRTLHGLFPIHHLKLHLMRIFCFLIYQYGIFYYLTKESLFNTTVLQNIAPLFIPLFDRLFMRHPIHRATFVSMGVSFVGVLMILHPNAGLFTWMSLIGLVSAVAQGGSQFLYSLQNEREKNDASIFYLYFFSSILSLVILWITSFWQTSLAKDISLLRQIDFTFYLYLLALSLCSIFNQSFRGMAYRHGRASVLAPFLYFSVPLSAALEWAVFDHLPGALGLLGSSLIICGGLLQYVANRSKT